MAWTVAVGAVAAAAVFWGLYFRFKDRLRPEPLTHVIGALLLGAVAAVLAVGVFRLLPFFGVPDAAAGGRAGAPALLRCRYRSCRRRIEVCSLCRLAVVRWRAFDEVIRRPALRRHGGHRVCLG